MHQGDISPTEAHHRLQNNRAAVLIDVRTQPEWVFVGVPAVERLIRLSWQVFPSMQVNPGFVSEIEQMELSKDTEILCICRSGARSAAAASALTAAGYT
ncbi:MAG: rhodanese-like domain-containing protein, partial [Alphaproteobacteria bacterium]|nr:rhodanese-like domain-containing protein [Alphaproteobacteria bacterium]